MAAGKWCPRATRICLAIESFAARGKLSSTCLSKCLAADARAKVRCLRCKARLAGRSLTNHGCSRKGCRFETFALHDLAAAERCGSRVADLYASPGNPARADSTLEPGAFRRWLDRRDGGEPR